MSMNLVQVTLQSIGQMKLFICFLKQSTKIAKWQSKSYQRTGISWGCMPMNFDWGIADEANCSKINAQTAHRRTKTNSAVDDWRLEKWDHGRPRFSVESNRRWECVLRPRPHRRKSVKTHGSPWPKKARQVRSNVKTMLIRLLRHLRHGTLWVRSIWTDV